jgi:O-antigen/teichoic acid export membrane protein
LKAPIRSVIRDVFIYGAGDFVQKAMVLIAVPIYTRVLSPSEYGIYSYIVTAVAMLGTFLLLGGESAYARYFFEVKTEQGQKEVTTSLIAFLFVWSGSVSLICIAFARRFSIWSFGTPARTLLFVLALAGAPIVVINTMFGQVLRNQFRAVLFTTLSALSALLTTGLAIAGALIWPRGLTGMFAGLLCGGALMLPVRFWSARSALARVFSPRLLKQMLAFGTPLVPVALAYWVFGSSDRMVLAKLATLREVGLYSVANTASGILALGIGAMGQALSPHAVRVYEQEPEAAPAFLGRILTYILAFFGFLAVGISVFSREAVRILAPSTFAPASSAIMPLALGYVAYAATQVTASGISLKKKTAYFWLYTWIAALLNLGLNIVFVPRWGMMAASWSTAASYVFLAVAYLVTSQRLWRVEYEKSRAVTLIALTVAFCCGSYLVPQLSLLSGIVLKCAYCAVFVALAWAFRGLDRREWAALVETIRAARLRFAQAES